MLYTLNVYNTICKLYLSKTGKNKILTNIDSLLKRHNFVNKGLCSQIYGFFSSHVWM